MSDPLSLGNSMNQNLGMDPSSPPNPMGIMQRNNQASYLSHKLQPPSQQPPQNHPLSQNLLCSEFLGMNTAASINGAMGNRVVIPGASGSMIAGPHKYAAQMSQQGQMQFQAGNIHPGGAPQPGSIDAPVISGMKPLDAAFAMKNGQQQQQQSASTPTGFVKEKIKIPQLFAPDALSKISLNPLTTLTEWSEKLKKEGKTIPLDVKLYEDIIRKDEFFLRKSLLQAQSSKELLDRMARDIKSYGAIKQLRMGAINSAAKNQYSNSIWGEGYLGYGNGVTNSATQVVMPFQNKCFAKPGQVTITDEEMNKRVLKIIESNTRELVPIRLEFDQERDRFKLRDTFLWDLNDTSYPIDAFVRSLVDDYSFISDVNFQTILQSVKEQIKEYKSKPLNAIGEIRIPIKIDLLINNTQFTDQFEWDILSEKDNDPEEFANILCDELNLPGDFATSIAFSIREQSQMYYKALSLVGYSFDGSHIREDEIKSHMAPPLRIMNSEFGREEDFITTLRAPVLLADYSPAINRITQLEIEKIEKELERDSRRRRRHNNESAFSYSESGPNLFGSMGRGTASRRSTLHTGRGVKTNIQDLSDVPKTFRTPIPSSILPGGIDLDAPDIYGYNELVVNRTQIANPDYKPPAPPGMVTIFKDSAGSFFVKIRSKKLRS